MQVVPRKVHEHVYLEHARVRLLAADLLREALQTGRDVGHRVSPARLALLCATVGRAIDVEERELVPMLQSTGGRAAEATVADLHERHARVLGVLEELAELEELEGLDPAHHDCALVSRVEELIGAFSADLDEREALPVSPKAAGSDRLGR